MNQDSSRERVSGGGFARGRQRTHLARQVLNWLRDSSAGWGADSSAATLGAPLAACTSRDRLRCCTLGRSAHAAAAKRYGLGDGLHAGQPGRPVDRDRSADASSRCGERSARRPSGSTSSACRRIRRASSTTRSTRATRRCTSCSRAAARSRSTVRRSRCSPGDYLRVDAESDAQCRRRAATGSRSSSSAAKPKPEYDGRPSL